MLAPVDKINCSNPAVIRTSTPIQQTRNKTVAIRTPLEDVTWIGRQFFLPSGYRMFGLEQLEQIFGSVGNTLWLGDSTIRRAMLTLSFMLKTKHRTRRIRDVEDNPAVNVNKGGIGMPVELCARFTNESVLPLKHEKMICRNVSSSRLDYFSEGCVLPMQEFIAAHARDIITDNNYGVVILSTGLHDLIGNCNNTGFWKVKKIGPPERLLLRQNKILQELEVTLTSLLANLNNNATFVIWRSNGYNVKNDTALIAMKKLNERIRDLISTKFASQIHLLDWAKAIEARSTEEDRITGDNGNHYGHEARILFLQMLANILMERFDINVS